MSTTFTDLKSDIQDITENTFTNAQLTLFIEQAEQLLLNSVQIPALRNVDTSSLVAGTATLAAPTGYLYTISMAINHGNEITFLLPKEASFIQEAYPSSLTANRAKPTHYAQFGENSLIFGPTPDQAYVLSHTYAAYPTSITTSGDGTSWLGTNMDSALLNASLVEAARFMKADPDIVAMYKEAFANSLTMLKQLGDGKLEGDVYRNGQPKTEVL